jgi:hypothetical protein
MFEDFDDEIGPWDHLEPAEGARQALQVLIGSGTVDERGDAAIYLGSVLDLLDDGDPIEEVPLELGQELRAVLWAIYDAPAEPELVRRRALEALVRWPIDPVPSAVRKALDTPGEWRVTGLFCAGFVTGFEDDVRQALATGNLEERVEAWRAVSNLELQDLGATAMRLALDPETERAERFEAIAALAWVGDPIESIDALETLAEDEDDEIAEVAAECIALRVASDEDAWDEEEE